MSKIYIILCLVLPFFVFAQPDTTEHIIPNRKNSAAQQQKPYVILISADGFRNDFADNFQATNLQRLRAKGVAAKAMIPAYPTLTFPNHYTIATGLYPSHHGIVDNTFYDPQKKQLYRISNRQAVEDSSWYGGTPIWVLAEQQQMISACFYWVGSEAAIRGVRPTHYYRYSELISLDKRIETVKNWLTLPEEKRPHLITFYISDVDHEAHTYGPSAKRTGEAVHIVDETVAKLVRMTDSLQLPVNYIFVSDHGMTAVDTTRFVDLPAAVDTNQFYFPNSEEVLHLYAKDKKFIEPAYKAMKASAKDYDVYKLPGTPKHWHYSGKDDVYKRAGDLLLVPKWPMIFNIRKRKILAGQHGFDNAHPDMRATFYAWGPAFKENLVIEPFENVHIYPLIANILGLNITGKIDGKPAVLQHILRQ
jgi:predicted AlkP superfamily pyrophosphatase or phosphodiesterase